MTRINRAVMRKNSDRGRLLQTATLICGAVGLDTDLSFVYQLFALLLCLLIGSRVSLRFHKPQVMVRRRLPRHATADEPFEYRVTVTNTGDRAERDLRLNDNPRVIAPDLAQFKNMKEPFEETRNAYDRWIGFHRFVYLQRLNTGIVIEPADVADIDRSGHTETLVAATPLRRGIVQFESVTLLHPDPLGLNYGAIEFPMHDQLTVLPKRYPVARNLLSNTGRNFQPGGVNSTWSIGESDEFASLRDYRDGDPIRKIHWASTAKRSKPVVKEFQDEFFARQGLIVDNCLPEGAKPEKDYITNEVFEAQIVVAASLLTANPTIEGLMDLFTHDEAPRVYTAGRGFGDCVTQLEVLARLGRSNADPEPFVRLVADRAKQLSGCLLVFNGYGDLQRALVAAVDASGIDRRIFIVSSTGTADDETDYPAGTCFIPADNVEAALAVL